jgi:hypothetical protein
MRYFRAGKKPNECAVTPIELNYFMLSRSEYNRLKKRMLPMIFRGKMLLILVSGFLCALHAATPEQQASFFAGVFILESRKDLSDNLKAVRFRELEAVSGMKASDARALLASLRTRPGEWKRLYDRMMQIVAEAQAVEQKKIQETRDTLSKHVIKRR